MMSELAHTEEFEGFTIRLYLEPEDNSIRDSFDEDEEGYADLEDKVERGIYLWFCAKVTASKAGVTLGTDYLGACMYGSVEEFLQPGGYWDDMKSQAVDEARKTLAELCVCEEA